ncbi:reverse transcriptase [Gossypium australe]|uniref:Reverse transcriptase n=1 Tax=Gossypium australe TaxID=47621 RepID=A0A5B6WIF8_9ROSI|nr:reverse transcriptase [Gossypium australe]
MDFIKGLLSLKVAQKYLNGIYKLYAALEIIVSDQDKVFVSQFWKELFKRLGIKLHLSITYHLESDGCLEDT